jgi:DNA-binding LytR/AlgR family response regulator
MNLKCLIIDDEPIARKVIREFVQKIPYLELVGEASNPVEADSLLSAGSIDLVFLDIEMPHKTGINFLKETPYKNFLVIITTAYPSHALEGYELNVLDYLLKPIAIERFLIACNKAWQYFEKERQKKADTYFFVKAEGRIEKIEYEDILYIESLGNYLTLYLTWGKMIVYLTLRGLLEQLPENEFIQVHKSYIINKSKVKRIENNTISIDKYTVPIGQKMKEDVLKLILGDKVIKR